MMPRDDRLMADVTLGIYLPGDNETVYFASRSSTEYKSPGFNSSGEQVPTFDVYDNSGVLLRTVTLPVEPLRTQRIRPGVTRRYTCWKPLNRGIFS